MPKAKRGESEVAALLRHHRKEVDKAKKVETLEDELDNNVPIVPKAPPAINVGRVAANSGHPPEGGPRDLGGAYPSGSDLPPCGLPPDGGPDGCGGDLEIVKAAAFVFVSTYDHISTGHSSHKPHEHKHATIPPITPPSNPPESRAHLVRPQSKFHRKLMLDPFLSQVLPKDPQRRLECLLWMHDLQVTDTSALIHGFRSYDLAGDILDVFKRASVLWSKREAARARVRRGPYMMPPRASRSF